MASLYALKPQFQRLLRPIVRACAREGITANQITVATCLLSCLLGAALLTGPRSLFFLLPVWCFLRMALNAIDGLLAREHGQQSTLGLYLNELTDVIADTALILPFATVPRLDPLAIAAVAVLAVISEMAGIAGALAGLPRRNDGPLGKSDRALLLGALGIVAGLAWPIPAWTPAVLTALLFWTIGNRVRHGVKHGPSPH